MPVNAFEWGPNPDGQLPDIEGLAGKVFYVWFDAPIEYIGATWEWADARALEAGRGPLTTPSGSAGGAGPRRPTSPTWSSWARTTCPSTPWASPPP